MKRDVFLRKFEEIIDEEPNALSGRELLKDLVGWDSLATLSFQALIDEYFNLRLPASTITSCASIQDLIRLLGDNIE